jgi:phosphoribosylformimino-5-aminoimidazole carboxamide ribotide isomerase
MRFRPCIDLHSGQVKQIIGSTLQDDAAPQTNFTGTESSAHYASMYRRDGLSGGHVIMLGRGNDDAAAAALAAFPDGLHVGGGINAENAASWLSLGASHVILTSYVFHHGQLLQERLDAVAQAIGPDRLVLDLSCAWRNGRYVVMTDRWQRASKLTVDARTLERLGAYCSEFLIHATAVEGRQQGIDTDLVALLGDAAPIPTTYAGGVRSQADIELIGKLGQDRLDYTVGSALDIFGGQGLRYGDLVPRHAPPGGH